MVVKMIGKIRQEAASSRASSTPEKVAQLDVDHQAVGRAVRGRLEKGLGGIERAGHVAVGGQQAFHGHPHSGIVIDDRDGLLASRGQDGAKPEYARARLIKPLVAGGGAADLAIATDGAALMPGTLAGVLRLSAKALSAYARPDRAPPVIS
jgi:hypothetical protein